MKERKDRVDDGLHATRAAVEEGIVPGGGVALARASLILAKLNAENDDQRVGIEIVRKAVQMPLRQIAENAGEDGAVISGKVLDRDEYNWGFDAQTGEFKDMVKAGIIDPTKVVRSALQHAASVGSLMITTEAMVAERQEKSRCRQRIVRRRWLLMRDDRAARAAGRNPMVDQDAPDPQFDAMTARLLRREALRRAAEELNTTSGPGLEEPWPDLGRGHRGGCPPARRGQQQSQPSRCGT